MASLNRLSTVGRRCLFLGVALALIASAPAGAAYAARAAGPVARSTAAVPRQTYAVFGVGNAVYLVDAHGRIVAHAAGRGVSCCLPGGDYIPPGAAAKTCCVFPGAVPVYPTSVSATRNRVYYLDGDTRVISLSSDGRTRLAATVHGGPATLVGFAVSPDDRRIAVAERTYLPLAGHPNYVDARNDLRLYVEDLGSGAHHQEIFEQTFDSNTSEWPVGWYRGNLVVAVGPVGTQQYAWQNPYAAANGYHLVNPDTGRRLATICAGDYITGISPSGPLSAAGTACWQRDTNGGPGSLSVAHWDGSSTPFSDELRVAYGFVEGVASPDGKTIALSDGSELRLVQPGGAMTSVPLNLEPWGWLDSRHLIVAKSSTDATGLAVLDLAGGTLAPIALPVRNITAFAYLGPFPSQLP